MEFAVFAARAADIEAANADYDIRDLVTALLHDAGDDLAVVSRFVQGRIFPAWDQTKLDVGPALCYEAIAKAAGQNVTPDDVEERLADIGDIGGVAASFDLGGQRGLAAYATGSQNGTGDADQVNGGLTVAEVEAELLAIAGTEGAGSHDRKLDRLFGLFTRCSPEEARYLARLVLSEMRIGVGEGTVRDAVAAAFDVSVQAVERAIQVSNDVGLVAEVARDTGPDGLAGIHLEIGRPVQSMLAQTGTVTEALEDWTIAAVEWKYDGARIQAHVDDDGIQLFSRNLEDVTDPLPEIVEFLESNLDGPAILDGEVVAVDDAGQPLPFQEVLRRFRRKYDVEQTREDVALRPYFFDCLHARGEDLLDQPLEARHEQLETVLDDGVSERVLTDDRETIAAIEGDALAAGHEGIMVKDPDSTYTPGRRGKHWRKIKPDVETLDLVVTGAEWGEGRRATFLGTYVLSVRDGDGFATVGKVATGITDEELAELTDLLQSHIRGEDGTEVDLEPAIVFEVGYEEIQRSPTYDSGYALRFPRFVAVRSDKDPVDAETLETIESRVESR